MKGWRDYDKVKMQEGTSLPIAMPLKRSASKNDDRQENDRRTEKVTVKWDAKNTVFIDLFNIPKFRLQPFQSLHPEISDVSEDDIVSVTLNPVIINQSNNDLGLLVRDKLLIFVEAQSTWSINILIRILLYLAMTYQDFITEHKLYVYGSRRIDLPKPEFYVVFTGDRKFEKDVISLRDDYWYDPNASLDLKAKIIFSENKDDIIGQYIIFCHVLDEQIKKHGRNAVAVEETIRICKNEGVLNEYLESREKEVISIMITLFDQEYAVEAYAENQKREGEIRGVVTTCKDLGISVEDTIRRIAEKFGFTIKESETAVADYWN